MDETGSGSYPASVICIFESVVSALRELLSKMECQEVGFCARRWVETEWGSCPVVGSSIRSVESSACVTKELVRWV